MLREVFVLEVASHESGVPRASIRPALAGATFLLTIDMPWRVADIVRAPETARFAAEASRARTPVLKYTTRVRPRSAFSAKRMRPKPPLTMRARKEVALTPRRLYRELPVREDKYERGEKLSCGFGSSLNLR